MKIVDLKRTKKEAKKLETGNEVAMTSQEKYPYGLSINLDDNTLKKFDIDGSEFKAGQKLKIAGIAIIENIERRERIKEKPTSYIRLQITNMGLEKVKPNSSSIRSLKQILKNKQSSF